MKPFCLAVLNLLRQPSFWLDTAPEGYPLPRAEDGTPFCRINLSLIGIVPGWGDWQARRDMAEIIPVIADAMARAKALS